MQLHSGLAAGQEVQTCHERSAVIQCQNDKGQNLHLSGLCGQKWPDPPNVVKDEPA